MPEETRPPHPTTSPHANAHDPRLIAALIEANMDAYLLSYDQLPGATAYRGAEVSWVDSGRPAATFNSVVAAHFAADEADAGIEAVLGHFRRVGRAFTWHVWQPSTPPSLGDLLVSHGLAFNDDEPGMAVALDQHGPQLSPEPAGLRIEPVRTEADVADWVDTWLFPVPEVYRPLYHEVLRQRALVADAPWRYFLGRLDGRPVATSERFSAGGVASVQYVVTLPDMRRRGFGAAMTRAALDDARAQGCHTAVLTASPDGVGIYRRLGFQTYCRIRRYEWEPSSS